MVDVNWAGVNTGVNGFSAYNPIGSGGIGLPTGRAMANGSTACLITALYGYVAGHGAARTIQLQLGSATTGAFGVGAAANGNVGTGWVATNGWLVNGGSANYYIYNGATSVYFGRSSGATNTSDSSGATYSGTLAGWYRYVQSPPAMAAPTCSATGSSLTVTFTAPSDSGDGTISGYVIQYSTDPAFGSATTVSATSSPTTITGLAPGMYYVRVSSSNEATAAASTYAPWSTSVAQRVGIGGARWDSTAGAEVPFTVGMRWDATAGAEVAITVAKRWDAVNNVEVDL